MKRSLLSAALSLLIFTAKAQWLHQNAGFTNDTLGFYEMSLPDKNTAWAICYDGKNGLNSGRLVLDFTRTKNGGATWIPGKMGNDPTLEFSNITALSDKEAWVAMHKLNGITGGGLYQTTNGGVTWVQSNAGKIFDQNSFPDFVYFKNKNKGIAVGDPNNGYFEIYTTTNGGKKWKRVSQANIPATAPNEYGWISGYAAVDNTIWFGTTAGRIYKSNNFGKDWTVYTADTAGKFVNEIAFNDDKLHGVAHLRNAVGLTFLYNTNDGGITWTNLGQPANWKNSRITAVPGTNAMLSTSVNRFNQGSAVSYDNGVTWTDIERTAPKAVARFYDAKTGYAGGFFLTGPPLRGGIYKSQIVFQQPLCDNRQAENNTALKQENTQQENVTADQLVKVYPTPANGVVNIALSPSIINTTSVMSIMSVNGKVIETRRSKTADLVQIDVSKYAPGSYILRIDVNGQTINRVITVAR